MLNLRSVKTQLIIYLSSLAVFLVIKDRDLVFFKVMLVGLVFTPFLEFAITYLKTKSLQVSESSVITGLIIGFVLSAEEAVGKVIFASFLAILSKQILRFKNKHIFNPAAFGIFSAVILSGASTGWKGTYFWYILVPFGLYFAYKIKKIEVITGYAIISLLLFGTQAVLQKVNFLNIFGYFSYFYIFVMVIEPKSSPVKTLGKYLFGMGTAALIFVLSQAGMRFDVELFSLLVMNATVPILNKLSPR